MRAIESLQRVRVHRDGRKVALDLVVLDLRIVHMQIGSLTQQEPYDFERTCLASISRILRVDQCIRTWWHTWHTECRVARTFLNAKPRIPSFLLRTLSYIVSRIRTAKRSF